MRSRSRCEQWTEYTELEGGYVNHCYAQNMFLLCKVSKDEIKRQDVISPAIESGNTMVRPTGSSWHGGVNKNILKRMYRRKYKDLSRYHCIGVGRNDQECSIKVGGFSSLTFSDAGGDHSTHWLHLILPSTHETWFSHEHAYKSGRNQSNTWKPNWLQKEHTNFIQKHGKSGLNSDHWNWEKAAIGTGPTCHPRWR